MSRHNEYDAYRYLSSSKAGKVVPPKPMRLSDPRFTERRGEA